MIYLFTTDNTTIMKKLEWGVSECFFPATLLEFNPQEEQHVKDFLEYKVCTSPFSYHTHLLVLIYCSLLLIGASVSEPLSIHLNVNFICLSVRLSVMDRPLTVNHFRLLLYVFCVMR